MITNKGDIIMKHLFILFAILMLSLLCCSSVTEPQEKPMSTEIYTLPYNQHYDHDARFFSVNPVDTVGVLRKVKFYAYNFGDNIEQYPDADPTVFFNFFLTVNYYDTLYFSPYLSTEDNTEFIVTLNEKFDGPISVHMYRYETFKPIDFKCEVLYSVKN